MRDMLQGPAVTPSGRDTNGKPERVQATATTAKVIRPRTTNG